VSLREVAVLAPVLALLLVFGVYPKVLTDRINPTTQAVVRHVGPDHPVESGPEVVRLADPGEAPRDRHRRSGRPYPDAARRVAPDLPEVILVGTGLIAMLYEAFAPRSERGVHLALSLAGLAGAAVAAYALWDWTGAPTVLAGAVARRPLRGGWLGSCSSRSPRSGLLYGTHYFARTPEHERGEFYPLVLFATAGMTLIAASADLIVMFLALEILSLSLYVLTGFSTGSSPNEASMKYFLLGAFSSAFFLYGVAMAYGATGTTRIGRSHTRWPGRPAARRWRCWGSCSSSSGSRSR
jgi:hypothetical protein